VAPASALWSFALVVGLLTLAPGVDTALIVRTSVLGAQRRAWGVVLGIQSGTLAWGTLTAAGVTALLTASRTAYALVRLAGACYLLWLGARMLWATGRRQSLTPTPPRDEGAGVHNGLFSAWRQGALTNLLNPKMGAFYVALLPQFIPHGSSPFMFGILLTCVHIALGTAWSTVLVFAARKLRGLLLRPFARRLFERVTGTVIAGFGLRLACSSR
jgi:threonine/homoserine/homoserine lactone efflux protein